MLDLGTVKPCSTIRIPFGSYDGGTGASVAASAYVAADIEVYKDGSETQRASDAGYTATTSFDSATLTGQNLVTIDLSDNTTANFYEAGSEYLVFVGPITIDAQTVHLPIARFIIGYESAVLNTTIAGLTDQNTFTLEDGSADDDAYNGCTLLIHDLSSEFQIANGAVKDYTGSSKEIELGINALGFTIAVGDNVSIFPAVNAFAIWEEVLTGAIHNLLNSSGRILRQIQEAGGYSGGAVYVDTVDGTAGTTNFENGTETKPSLTIADANTIATSLGISRFVIAPGSSITFAAPQEGQEFIGRNWTLALGGQSISDTHISGAEVSGTGTAATSASFDHCGIGTCTIGQAHLDECDLESTVTLSDAATYHFVHCSHAGAAIIDFGAAVGVTTVHVHDYAGALIIDNLGATGADILHFDGTGKLTLNASCTGGTANISGTFDFDDQSATTTIVEDGAVIEDTKDIQSRLPTTLSSGRMRSDQEAIDGNVDAAKQLRDNLDTTLRFIVDDTFTPTTTQTQVDAVFFGDTSGTLNATDDHHKDATVIGLTGANKDVRKLVTAWDGTNKRFTHDAFPVAFANNDELILV